MRHESHRMMLAVGGVVWMLLMSGRWDGPAEVAAAGESAFVGLSPCRLVDTRNGAGALVAGAPRDFQLQGQCGIATTAVGVSLNVTATNTQGPGFLMLYPQGGAQPLVSTLNYLAGETVANAALVPLGPGGLTVVAGVSGADLILDVNGYFADSLVHEVNQTGIAVGTSALAANTSGLRNTAIGPDTLESNTTGGQNTAIGFRALVNLIDGNDNTAVGPAALEENTTGDFNTALGVSALHNATGSNNIAIGFAAGVNVTSGNNNIHIGDGGDPADSDTMRLGSLQTRTFIAGIAGATTGASAVAVLIDGAGQLGIASSSRRVKTDIEAVGERSRGLHALRPVSFRYRAHPPDGPVEYGLIAEEVVAVYPELVVRDATGELETVRYHLLPALLLNEIQRQERALAEKDRQLTELVALVATLAARVGHLERRAAVAQPGGDSP
jgi:hypothetical protein